MVVKVYISGISGNKEVKKRQQRVLMILDSKNIKYEIIDITEPGRESDKDFMQNNAKSNGGTVSDPNPRSPLPPQLFNDDDYCGDYDQFDMANEVDTLEQFLKLEVPTEEPQVISNGDVSVRDEVKEESTQNDTEIVGKEEVNEDNQAIEPSEDKSSVKEPSEEKETATDRLKSQDEDGEQNDENQQEGETISERKDASKDNTPPNDDAINGSVTSREPSKEKEIIDTDKIIDNPSVALIESEQAASIE